MAENSKISWTHQPMSRVGKFEAVDAPAWMQEHLNYLCRLLNLKRDVMIVVAAPDLFEQRIGVTEKPHAFTIVYADRPDVIVLPNTAEDTVKWRSAIKHEFLHLLHWHVDDIVWRLTDDEAIRAEYMAAVEAFINPMQLLLMITDVVDVRYTEEGDLEDST